MPTNFYLYLMFLLKISICHVGVFDQYPVLQLITFSHVFIFNLSAAFLFLAIKSFNCIIFE